MKNHILGSLGNNEDKPSFFLAAKYNVSMNTAEVLKDAENKPDHEVLALSTRDPRFFEVIVNRYEQVFINKISAILKNKEEAQDVVQDTFVKIYMNAHRFELQEGASFKSWGYKILLNTCFTFCKKNKRQKDFVSNVDQDILNSVSASVVSAHGGGAGSGDEYEKKLDTDHFLFVVSKLPETFGKLLKRVALEGKTHEDISKEEGISVGAVRTRLHRARREFKKVKENYL